MAASIRTEAQRESDLVKLSEMYLRGYTQMRMAKELKLSRSTIVYDLEKINADWRKRHQSNVDALKVEQLAKLDHLEAVAWDAWERSIGKKRKRKTTEGAIGVDEMDISVPVKHETTEWVEVGDPRFLERIDKCIERRSAILGINAPIKTAETDAAGNDIEQRRNRVHAELIRLFGRNGEG